MLKKTIEYRIINSISKIIEQFSKKKNEELLSALACRHLQYKHIKLGSKLVIHVTPLSGSTDKMKYPSNKNSHQMRYIRELGTQLACTVRNTSNAHNYLPGTAARDIGSALYIENIRLLKSSQYTWYNVKLRLVSYSKHAATLLEEISRICCIILDH